MMGNGTGNHWQINRISRVAVIVALVAAVFVVVPPAHGAAVPGTVNFVSTTGTAPEGTAIHTVEVALTVGSGNTLDANFSVDVDVIVDSPGTADDPTDYTYLATHTVTFLAGATDATPAESITINIVGDTTDEVDETIELELATVTGTGLIGAQNAHQVTITDDDSEPSLSIDDPIAVTEGATSSFTVTLSAASGKTVSVSYATADGTAVAPDDYTADSDTLTFTAGQTSKTINVTTINDTVDENQEAFTVNLSGETNATITDPSGTGTINDNDTAGLSISNDTVTEGTTASFTVTLSPASSQTVTVNYATANGSAVEPGDYTADSDTLTFTAGQTSKTINVTTINDTVDENQEAFTVNLSGATNATITDPSGTGTINDNDTAPTVSIANSSATESAGSITFNATLSAPSGKTITVKYATSNGTAIAGNDYTVKSGTLTFSPGDTSEQVAVSLINDSRDEPNEAFAVSLSDPVNTSITGGPATGTITDDDPTPTLAVNSVQVDEGLTASFTVTLSAASGRTVTVKYATANGTAVAPGDYTAHGLTTLTFTPGQTTKTINVATVQDTLDEATNETFNVVLSAPSNATVPVPSGTGSITDNDGAPGLSVVDATPVSEGPTAKLKFTVKLLPASGQTVTVKYATANGTAVAPGDYTAIATPTTLTFTPGQTTKDVFVTIANDTVDEIAETVMLNLTSPTNTSPIAPADAQGVGTILDNDNIAPAISLMQTSDLAGNPGFEFMKGQAVKLKVNFTDPGLKDTHSVTVDWGDGTAPAVFPIAPIGGRTFERTHTYTAEGFFQISMVVADADGGSVTKPAFVTVAGGATGDGDDTVGLVDPTTGLWRLYNDLGDMATQFYYGKPGDVPFMGDWDGDGIDTPGLYRQSDGFAYLRNINTQGNAHIRFFFGNPGDIPIAGDFNGDGFDTLSIYRPSNQTFYIINKLGANNGGLGAAEFSYVFGNPGDKPFVGDFDGDGIDTVGLHRETTGLVYFRNSHSTGNANHQFIYGDPGDQIVSGDWTVDGVDTPALYRSSDQTFYFRFTNTQGHANATFDTGLTGWIPVVGVSGA